MVNDMITRYARVLVDAIRTPEGSTILVSLPAQAKDLQLAIGAILLDKGVRPHFQVYHADYEYVFYTHASEDVLSRSFPIDEAIVKATDGRIVIRTQENSRTLTSVDPAKVAMHRKAGRDLQRFVVDEQDNWVLGMYPNHSLAQDAEMSLFEYEEFFYGAVLQDWAAQKDFQFRLKDLLEHTDSVRIVAKDTDLSFSIKGKKARPCYGQRNIPDGEVFTEPVKHSVSGHVTFSYPVISNGREVEGIRLEFSDGEAVGISASKNEEYLRAMLGMDEGSSYIGEFGIGTNYGISRFTKQILFDEKIGGSIHLALGNAYAETGGENQSALHWDMILDLRDGGEMFFDGVLVQKDGKFRI